MNRNKYKIFTVILLLSVISSCYYDKENELYPNSICDIQSVSFSTDISPIIKGYCATAGCHVAGAQAPDLSSGYAAINSNKDRIYARAVTLKTMPSAAPLTPCNIQRISKWYNNGAQNN